MTAPRLDLDELTRLANAATPGPWAWELNIKSKCVSLVSHGRGRMLETVMDFVRWGMDGAAPRFRSSDDIMRRADLDALPVAGREHHASWHQRIAHRDAEYIAALDPATVLALVARARRADELEAGLHITRPIATSVTVPQAPLIVHRNRSLPQDPPEETR